jgi:hypothetical protein
MLQGRRYVITFTNSPRIKLYVHAERMENERMKQLQ